MGTIPILRTWVAGEMVTAAYFNTNIRDAGNFLLATPTFQGRQSITQSLANATNVAILVDTEIIDSDNGHSTVTNTSRFTPATPGYYQLGGGVGWALNTTGLRCTWWAFNNATVVATQNKLNACTGAATCLPARTKFMGFNGTTDYAEIMSFQNSGGALNTSVSNEEASDFNAHWVRT